jgi:sulfur relay protein TusB/DsrH
MLLLITSSPDTDEFKRAITLANSLSADVCFMQDAVYGCLNAKQPLRGNIYTIADDLRIRGITEKERLTQGLKIIDHPILVDLIMKADKVVGTF